MIGKDLKITKSILGEDIFEVLEKYEIYKPNTKTVVDPEEIKVALQIVPRSILSYLFANLKHMSNGDIADLELPFEPNTMLHVEKLSNDNYKGDIVKEGKKLYEFQYRSLPSIGLILLSTLELYDVALLEEIKQKPVSENTSNKIDRLQDIIDERLSIQRMVQSVVENKLSQRDAISKLIDERLNSHIIKINYQEGISMENDSVDKKSKLKLFLEGRELKRQEPVELDKKEIVCSDCNTILHKSNLNAIKLCVCYGEYRNKEIKFTKTEDGKVRFKFPKKFDTENIEMLLETIGNGR